MLWTHKYFQTLEISDFFAKIKKGTLFYIIIAKYNLAPFTLGE